MVPAGPLRRLAAGTLVSAVGNGAWYTSWALFLTRSVGLSPAQVGLGMTVAGIVGVLSATPLGRLADRLAVLGALRSISHVGWAIGAVAGAVIIGVDSRPGYVALLLLNAASYAVYALLAASVPRVAVAVGRAPLRVVHDRPYVTLAGLMGVLALCWAMLSSGLPLWVAHTDAPRAVSAVIVAINSLAIALLQVRASRGMASPALAARGAVLSGGALAASCLVFALTAGGSAAPSSCCCWWPARCTSRASCCSSPRRGGCRSR